MSVRIRKGFQAEISAKGFAPEKIFAETAEDLDAEVDAYFNRLEAAMESRSRKFLAQMAGRQRQLYKDARAALEE